MNKERKQIRRLLKTHISMFKGGSFPQYNFTVDELRHLFRKNRLRVVTVIGKPVFARLIPRNEVNTVLSDKRFFKELLRLETMFNSEPSIIGLSGHMEIVGRKM